MVATMPEYDPLRPELDFRVAVMLEKHRAKPATLRSVMRSAIASSQRSGGS
jgi:hypothetical protein